MHYPRQTLLLALLLLHLGLIYAQAADCHACKATDLPGLVMNCPECGSKMHDPTQNYLNQTRSSLKIRLLYSGENPDKLPAYGKLFINGKYRGNIDMIEKQEKNSEALQVWTNGLGREFSCYYEKIFSDLPSGILKIEVEMKFDRMFGFGRSYKRVVFPYVSFKSGEQTSVEHYFFSAATFSQFNPTPPKPIPVISEAKLQGASGTVAINIPLFK